MTQTLTKDSNYLKEVRDQYEHFPYPPRDPKLEKTQFIALRTMALDCLNYYHYCGKRDFTKGFRALVAGGGTGDSTIALAEQFRGLDADIIHLDLSASSLRIAKERADVRGLKNITWIHGSLLDAPKLFSEKFDLIECHGVLHHLEDPQAGLAALTALLKDDGVMCLMLYARYGREAVYRMQHLMRILNKNEGDMQHKVDNCKTVLNQLPSTNRIKLLQDSCEDLKSFGDIGIYDLFLHSHDQAYTMPDVYQFLASSGLQPSHFFFDMQPEGNDLYRLEAYLGEESLSDAITHLSKQEKYTAAELINGEMIKHTFYATKHPPLLPSLDDLDHVPFFYMTMKNDNYRQFAQFLGSAKVGETFICEHHYHEVSYTNTPHLARMCKFMDANKSLGEIFSEVIASYSTAAMRPRIDELLFEFKNFFAAFNKMDMMFLRHKSVPKTVRIDDIEARSLAGADISVGI